MAAAAARRPSTARSRVDGESATRLLDPNHLARQPELRQIVVLALGFRAVEVAEADHVRDGVSRLGGDADQVALGADPLRQLHRGPEGHRLADAHREGLAAADHDGAGEALLAEGGDEGPGVLSGRDVLDEHAKDARPEALAVARDLVAGLAQAKLDLVGLGPGEERAKLERQRRGLRRSRSPIRAPTGRFGPGVTSGIGTAVSATAGGATASGAAGLRAPATSDATTARARSAQPRGSGGAPGVPSSP